MRFDATGRAKWNFEKHRKTKQSAGLDACHVRNGVQLQSVDFRRFGTIQQQRNHRKRKRETRQWDQLRTANSLINQIPVHRTNDRVNSEQPVAHMQSWIMRVTILYELGYFRHQLFATQLTISYSIWRKISTLSFVLFCFQIRHGYLTLCYNLGRMIWTELGKLQKQFLSITKFASQML